MNTKKKYDLVFSLGGTCAASKQLRKRGLQFRSFPFDWLFHVNESHISSIQKCFEHDFKDWLLKDNLKLLESKERGDSKLEHQYKDTLTGFRFIHDFHFSAENNDEYVNAKQKYQRRIDRLIKLIKKSKKVLLFLDCYYEININDYENLLATLSNKFPGVKFDISVINFCSGKEEVIKNNNIEIFKFKRAYKDEDFFATPEEWDCLKDVQLSFRGLFFQKTDFKQKRLCNK